MGSGGFQQGESAAYIRLNEGRRAMDAAIYVAFCGEMNNGPRTVGGQQFVHKRAIAYISLDKHMSLISRKRRERFKVSGVCQGVEIDHRLPDIGNPFEHEIGAYEPRAPCHKNRQLMFLSSAVLNSRILDILFRPAKEVDRVAHVLQI
jgi:hypothetical protein